MKTEPIYKTEFKPVDFCIECDYEYPGSALHDYFGKCCPECGAVESICPPHKTTSKRWVCTYLPGWFAKKIGKEECGYWEYSGKWESNIVDSISNAKIQSAKVSTNMANTNLSATVAAVSVTSGG
jgi:hypothetical protein